MNLYRIFYLTFINSNYKFIFYELFNSKNDFFIKIINISLSFSINILYIYIYINILYIFNKYIIYYHLINLINLIN